MDTANIQTWADIGVICLLWALGLEFSFKKDVDKRHDIGSVEVAEVEEFLQCFSEGVFIYDAVACDRTCLLYTSELIMDDLCLAKENRLFISHRV